MPRRFQSLLSWMLLSNIPPALLYSDNFGFNPCYPGCCSQTGADGMGGDRCGEFQSLLSWMLLSNPHAIPTRTSPGKVSILVILDVALKHAPTPLSLLLLLFQSLLSWMLLSNYNNIGMSYYRSSSFNPCYPGCCSQTSIISTRQRFSLTVSILVILDVALKLATMWMSEGTLMEFQSLLSWMLLSNPDPAGAGSAVGSEFQSLLSWMLLSNT